MTIVTKCLIAAILGTAGYIFAAAITLDTCWKAVLVLAGLFVLFQLLYIVVVYLASLTVKFEPIEKQSVFFRRATAGIAEILSTYPLIKTELVGLDKIPTDSRFLFVSNHRSGFDPILVMARMKKYNISFVSKPENMKIPLAGKTAYAAGALAIDRENNREALKTILQAAEYLKKDICNIAIYPEGTRSKTGELLPFHAGSFKIAQRANVPVVISCVSGTELIKKNMFRRFTKVTIQILEVIPADKVKEMNTNDLAEYAKSKISEGLSK